MTNSVRARLFGLSLLVVTLVVGVSGVFLESRLRDTLEAELEAEVVRRVNATRVMLVRGSVEAGEMDDIADELGTAQQSRVTIIALDGTVLGDTELDGDRLRTIDNHGQRPEVLEALRSGMGMARRYSTTVRAEMLYVALPYPTHAEPAGTVRVSIPLSNIDDAIWKLRVVLLLAGLIGIVLAVFMSGVASELTSRDVRRLVDRARAIVESHRDEAVADLAAERDRASAILERMRDGVLAIDARDRISIANDAAVELLQFDDDDIGRPLSEAVPIPALIDLAHRCLDADDATAEFEVRKPRHRQVLARAVRLEAMGGAVIVMHDVTEVRKLERVRRDFVANVSHELRTPVSIIRANAETLLDGALDERKRAYGFVDAVCRNAVRLSALIEDLLDLSRLEAGQYPNAQQRIVVAEAVAAAIDGLDARTEDGGFDIACDIAEDMAIVADSIGLRQVLRNLLDNAIKYSGDGGKIRVRAKRMADIVRIEVEDDGPGIDAQHRERVFERFYRIDKGRSRQVGGTGLGLSIVKHLIDAMNGRVGVEPAAQRGSIFWLELTAAASHPPAEAAVAPPTQER